MGKQTQSAPAKELTRKQLSRQAKDERTRRWLLYGTAAVLGLALLVLAYGLINLYVLAPRRPAATVNGVTITRAEYNKRLAYREWDYTSYLNQLESQRAVYAADAEQEFMVQLIDQQINSVQTELFSLPTTVLDELIDEEIVRQEAAKRGISISAEDLQYNFEQQFGYVSVTATPSPTLTPSATPAVSPTPQPTATSTVTPTPDPSTPTVAATATAAETATPAATVTPLPTSTPMSREQFDERLANWLTDANQAARFTEADLRALIEVAMLRQKIQQAISAEVPATAEQVHARHILFATQEEAEAALERITAGEDFAALATELSKDEGSKANGGDLGWFGRGVMLTEFENAAFSLPVEQVSGVIKSDAGFHLILVLEHEQNRDLDAAALESARTSAVNDWFEAQRASADIKRYL